MTPSSTILLVSSFLIALCGVGVAHAQQGTQHGAAGKPLIRLQMPALPEPVRVNLNPASTALLLLDFVAPICNSQPKCKDGMVSAVTPFLARARKAGVIVGYGTREQNMTQWLPEIAPAPGDIKVVSTAQDRFFNTDLDKELKAKNITTIILVGWKVSGSVTYTSVGSTVRGYTVVVPVDTTAAATDYEQTIGFYQILNQLNGNLANEPLKPKAPTLSRTDLISFQ